MAQHVMETGEKSARKAGSSASAEGKGSRGAEKTPEDASAAPSGDVDESKFSSLTASLLVRKRSSAAPSSGAAAARKSGGEVGFRVRKGFASPSQPLPTAGLSQQQDEELNRLRSACTSLQSHAAVREADLARAQADLKARERDLERVQTDLATREADLTRVQSELTSCEADLTRIRSDLAARDADLARVQFDLATRKSELERLQSELAGREAELSRVQSELAKRETEFAGAQSNAGTHKADIARLQAALGAREAELSRVQAELAKRQTEFAGAQSNAGTHKADVTRLQAELAVREADMARLKTDIGARETQLARMQSEIADRDAEIARLQAVAANERELWLQEADEMLAKTEAGFKAEAARRVTEAEAQWRQQTEALLAEAKGQAKAGVDHAHSEVLRLMGQCAELKGALANCEAALAQTRAAAQEEQERSSRALERALAETQARSEQQQRDAMAQDRAGAVAAREKLEAECLALRNALISSEAKLTETRRAAEQTQERLRQELQKAEDTRQAVARMETQVQAARGEGSMELRRLQMQSETAQRQLAEKDAELERLRLQSESLRSEIERHSKDAVVEAQRRWKVDEANRLAAAEAQWKKNVSRELADATARFETAERALSQLRIRNSARDASDNAEIARLRDELAALQAAAGTHPQESWEGDGGPAQEMPIVLRTNKDWERLDETRIRNKRRNFTGMITAAALLAVTIIYISMGGVGPLSGSSAFPGTPADSAPLETPAVAENRIPTAVLIRGANVRAAASGNAEVIASVTRGAEVTPLEQQGKWTRVRLADAREGWVFSEFLGRREQGAALRPGSQKAD